MTTYLIGVSSIVLGGVLAQLIMRLIDKLERFTLTSLLNQTTLRSNLENPSKRLLPLIEAKLDADL